jgi:hypothetical protein
MPDVFKILKDLELKSVGLDPQTNKMQEGYFVSFRSVGLPIHKEDFQNPWSPLGVNLDKNIKDMPPADPSTAPKTGSSALDPATILAAKVGVSMSSYLYTFLLTDDKLQMNSQYAVMPSSSKVSDTWYAIITGANGIPTDSQLSPAMKQAYDAATAKLQDKDGNPTPHYQAYLNYQDAYNTKVRSWQRAYAIAFTDPMKLQQWPIQGRSYHEDADAAMDQWVGLGFKNEIDNAIATLAAQGTDPAIAMISRAKKRYINSLNEFQSVGEIPYTIMIPRTWYDPDNDDGWMDYTSNDFHTESHYSSSSTSYGGGGGFSVGFWSVGGGFEHSDSRQAMNVQTSNLTVSFSYCAVDIKRPWLDTSLLNLKNWFLMGNYPAGSISKGNMGQQLPKNNEFAFLPSVVTSLVLIKDLCIKWDNWKSQWSDMKSSTSGSASVGWGPFAVSGHYSHQNQQTDFSADDSGEGLLVHGVQLLGYVSTICPLSPAVDSSKYVTTTDTKATGATGKQ